MRKVWIEAKKKVIHTDAYMNPIIVFMHPYVNSHSTTTGPKHLFTSLNMLFSPLIVLLIDQPGLFQEIFLHIRSRNQQKGLNRFSLNR